MLINTQAELNEKLMTICHALRLIDNLYIPTEGVKLARRMLREEYLIEMVKITEQMKHLRDYE